MWSSLQFFKADTSLPIVLAAIALVTPALSQSTGRGPASAKPPFYAMSETPGSNRFVLLTAEGAFLQQVLFGFTGLRLGDKGLVQGFRPSLPPAWKVSKFVTSRSMGKLLTSESATTIRFLSSPLAKLLQRFAQANVG